MNIVKVYANTDVWETLKHHNIQIRVGEITN